MFNVALCFIFIILFLINSSWLFCLLITQIKEWVKLLIIRISTLLIIVLFIT